MNDQKSETTVVELRQRGHVTIPAEIRRVLDADEGDILRITVSISQKKKR